MSLPETVSAVLLDIEGTTTPISFVYDVLFPFAKIRLARICATSCRDAAVAAAVERLRAEHGSDSGAGLPGFGDGSPYAAYLMEQDRKSTGLKALQGMIWKDAYESGVLKASVFDDVCPALEAWRGRGLRLRIFSSGSVLAQKLLFAHTGSGDLTGFFEGYHDTTTGPKQEAQSYRAIAEAYVLDTTSVLFLSDVVEELDAAREAGMSTGLVVRPGNRPVPPNTHPRYESLLALVD
jgi:enolase-phosphatase E1